MRHWSVRLRATVVATAVVALALGATVAVLVWVLRGSLQAAADQDANRKLEMVVSGIGAGEPEPGAVAVRVAPDGQPSSPLESDVSRLEPDVVVGSPAAPGWASGYATAAQVVGTPSGQTVVVQARSSLEPVSRALDAMRTLLAVGVPALLALVAATTWLLVGRALAPVTAIRAKFTEISASDLHRRVPVPDTRDEVARLALAMNGTLDRLEAAVGRHRRFVADAAHELRSPLATLRTRLELGQRHAPALVGEALVDVTRIQGLAADLLLLARLDAGEPPRAEEVDLGQVAAEAATEADLRSPRDDVRLALDVAPDVVARGSAGQLHRMVGNLVDNALRHAATTVTVRVGLGGVLEVVDDGPGIPAEHRERVFDRFTRLDEARVRDGGGAGLGLAIARDIARAHGGTLTVAPHERSCLRVWLPARSDAAGSSRQLTRPFRKA